MPREKTYIQRLYYDILFPHVVSRPPSTGCSLLLRSRWHDARQPAIFKASTDLTMTVGGSLNAWRERAKTGDPQKVHCMALIDASETGT